MAELKIIKGLVWPAADEMCCEVVFEEAKLLELIYPYITDWSTVVQAGGNCGVFAMSLARKFQTVYTFEPDPTNFTCLAHNTSDFENVVRLQAALGAGTEPPIQLARQTGNCGAHQVRPGGNIPVLTIDSLKLPSCGALLLDVEGYEYHALKGAVETIRRCRPVIQLELKGIGDQYGMPERETDVWLCSGLGYKREAKLANDRFYVPL